MSASLVGAVVAYQGRCWLVTRTLGAWLHLTTATSPGHYHSVDVPRGAVSHDLTATESSRHQMFCPLTPSR